MAKLPRVFLCLYLSPFQCIYVALRLCIHECVLAPCAYALLIQHFVCTELVGSLCTSWTSLWPSHLSAIRWIYITHDHNYDVCIYHQTIIGLAPASFIQIAANRIPIRILNRAEKKLFK